MKREEGRPSAATDPANRLHYWTNFKPTSSAISTSAAGIVLRSYIWSGPIPRWLEYTIMYGETP